MTFDPTKFGTLGEHLRYLPVVRDGDPDDNSAGTVVSGTYSGLDLSRSPGPISDAFLFGAEPMMLLNGPPGSAKTTTLIKKAIIETWRIKPWAGGTRKYTITFWREKYDNLWGGFIRSWWKVFPRDLIGSQWTGSAGRSAQHVINWRDQYGPCMLVAQFRAFGEAMDADDLKGTETTDDAFEEMDLLSEDLITWRSRAIGRDPVPTIMGRVGRMYGTCNAPNTESWVYRDFFEDPKDGYKLYRQPGGLELGAENLDVLGPDFYPDIVRRNAHRAWYVRLMVHNKPGFQRDGDLVYTQYDDDRHCAREAIAPVPGIPVLCGIDGGLTPAAVYAQEMPDGQARILGEICLEHGDEYQLAAAMLAYEARRFKAKPGEPVYEFETVCDPAMRAGEETEGGSMRKRLSKQLKRPVELAQFSGGSNNVGERHGWVREKLMLSLSEGRPGFIMDPECKTLRRGFNQGYAWARKRGTNERSRVQDGPTTHPHDGLQYAASLFGSSRAKYRESQRKAEKRARVDAARSQRRYDPFGRK